MYGYLLGMLGLRWVSEEKISRRFRLCLLLSLCLFHCGDQAPQADLDGSQIADLIDLQLGVQLAAGFQNPPHFICGNASIPQPKDTSCTSCISGCVVTYLAARYILE